MSTNNQHNGPRLYIEVPAGSTIILNLHSNSTAMAMADNGPPQDKKPMPAKQAPVEESKPVGSWLLD